MLARRAFSLSKDFYRLKKMNLLTLKLLFSSIIMQVLTVEGLNSMWDDWWTYEGISGPGYWFLNPEWALCSKGRNQSPINIDPGSLLFDPSLGPIVISGDRVSGVLSNEGPAITFTIAKNSSGANISEGPLSYTYRIKQIRMHFSTDNSQGSEHTIDGKSFPAEIQILAYNAELYKNLSISERSPRGMTVIAIFTQISEQAHAEFDVLIKAMNKTKYKGDTFPIKKLHLTKLMPPTAHYITYDGSLTHPGCYETVTWLILNKPIYVSKTQLYALRELNQAGRENPQMLMAGNIRPQKPLNQRTLRTNINFVCPACELKRVGQMIQTSAPKSHSCSMGKDMYYRVNERFKET